MFVYNLLIHLKRLEEFMMLHQETLSYFKTLLQYPKASSVKQENIMKYMAINIFSIQLLIDKNPGAFLHKILFPKNKTKDTL